MYVPELAQTFANALRVHAPLTQVFGHLLTSDNYDDSEKKAREDAKNTFGVEMPQVTGGRNGYGAKLTNIFSKRRRALESLSACKTTSSAYIVLVTGLR